MNIYSKREKGQVVLVVAIIILFVLIPLTALVVDGGMLLAARRQAQAAADAGALAGARAKCEGKLDWSTIAHDYATIENKAASATPSANGYEVTVIASVSHTSIFSMIIGGQPSLVDATATAACKIPNRGVLPLTFYCPNSEPKCGVTMFDWITKTWPTPPGPTLYVIPDPNSTQPTDPWGTCMGFTYTPPTGDPVSGKMICGNHVDATDVLDTEWSLYGIPEGSRVIVAGNGQRNYITDVCIDSSNPAQCVKDILAGNPSASLVNDGWYDIHNGTIGDFYNVLSDKNTVLPYAFKIPYYDGFTRSTVHVDGVITFMVTCASQPPNSQTDCPGKTAWLKANKNANKNFGGARTVEGYFVENHPIDLDIPGNIPAPNMGTYYISLIH